MPMFFFLNGCESYETIIKYYLVEMMRNSYKTRIEYTTFSSTLTFNCTGKLTVFSFRDYYGYNVWKMQILKTKLRKTDNNNNLFDK